MTTEEKVLDAMRKAGEPLNAGKIATLAGIDKKDVEKTMNKLKADGSIVSPKRCFWEPAK
jgi:predicted Zn-ribbon and HTH transcriptional regulator